MNIRRQNNGKLAANEPILGLASTVSSRMGFNMTLSAAARGAIVNPGRQIVDINALIQKLKRPMDASGKEIQIETEEDYEIYNCLKMMPECVKSMEITRGDKDGVKGSDRPLENTICVAIHHVDDKSYGGLCVLREWGATDMTTIFVGYNPLQSQVWRDMIADIPDDKLTACILETIPPEAGAPVWAEGVYRIARPFNKFPPESMLPSDAFDEILPGKTRPVNRFHFYRRRGACARTISWLLWQGGSRIKSASLSGKTEVTSTPLLILRFMRICPLLISAASICCLRMKTRTQ